MTVTQSGHILKSLSIPEQQPIQDSILKGLVCGPIQALQELYKVQQEKEGHEIFMLKLQQGDVKQLGDFSLEENITQGLKLLSLRKLSIQQQQFVLSYHF